MNSKEFHGALSRQLNISMKEAERLVADTAECMANCVGDGDTLSIQGFGNFDVKKKLERIVVNPTTKKRLLIPPKLTLNFKPSNVLKEKAQQ